MLRSRTPPAWNRPAGRYYRGVLGDGLPDLASVLFIAAGLGFAFACAYLVRRPGPRTMRGWVGAALVAVPGLLIGLVASDSDLGVRAAYLNLTRVLRDPLVIEAEIAVIPQPKAIDADPPTAGEIEGTPSQAPGVGAVDDGSADAPDDQADPEPLPSPVPTPDAEPPAPSPTGPPPDPTEIPPPSPTDTPPPTPSETPPPTPSVIPEP